MTAAIRDSLAQVQELLDRATPDQWLTSVGAAYDQVEAEDGPMICFASSTRPESKHNARAIAAAVNWLREHGPELMKRLEGKDHG